MRTTKFIASVALLSISILAGDVVTAGQHQNLPFVGTRYFNFMGGTATGYEITIKKNGTTMIVHNYRSFGKYIYGVDYKGRFLNPITVKGLTGATEWGGDKLLFKNNKAYLLDKKGNIIKGCRGEGKICEVDLSS
jgi:hypothetical protein